MKISSINATNGQYNNYNITPSFSARKFNGSKRTGKHFASNQCSANYNMVQKCVNTGFEGRALSTSVIRELPIEMEDDVVYFVDYDTKARFDDRRTLDFSSPKMKTALQNLKIGETVQVDKSGVIPKPKFKLFNLKDDIEPSSVKLMKIGKETFMIQ